MRDDKTRSATVAAIASNFLFGLSFLASRIALEHTESSTLLVLRFVVSVLVMLLLVATGVIKLNLKGKPILGPIMLGLFHPVIYYIGETNGIKYTNASFAGVMVALLPVATAVGSSIFLKERLQKSAYAWILCSVAGVAVISYSQTSEGVVSMKGVLYLLLSMLAGAGFYIVSRFVSDEFSPFERTFVMMIMGLTFYTALGFAKEGAGFASLLVEGISDKYVVFPVIYLAIACSVMGFVLQNYSATYLNVAKVTAFANMTPVISLLAGVLVLGEPFSAIYLLGVAMILLGVYKVNKANVIRY